VFGAVVGWVVCVCACRWVLRVYRHLRQRVGTRQPRTRSGPRPPSIAVALANTASTRDFLEAVMATRTTAEEAGCLLEKVLGRWPRRGGGGRQQWRRLRGQMWAGADHGHGLAGSLDQASLLADSDQSPAHSSRSFVQMVNTRGALCMHVYTIYCRTGSSW
jgi:hypothetical protein